MQIKIYAPVDCEIKNIKKCSDSTFANELLGSGLLIFPKNSKFYSPFKNAHVSLILDTKHAYAFEIKNLNVLMHCGLETVTLNGEPFKTDLKVGQKIQKKDLLFEVDLEYLKNNNISSQTPLVFSSEKYEIAISEYEEKEYKQGEFICKINLTEKKVVVSADKKLDLFKVESKYSQTANKILENVGGFANFKQLYNCMTRVRIKIINKKLVNEQEIKELSIVKGLNWIGDEFQIIIGSESANIKEEMLRKKGELESVEEENVVPEKISFNKKLMGGMSGIIGPNIRVLVASGILAVIYSLLIQFNLAKDLGNGANMQNADLISTVLFTMTKVGILLIGVFFCITATKYFGGNYLIGVFVGLILSSRFFIATNGIENPEDYTLGSFIENKTYGTKGWYLFSIWDYPIVVRSYEGTVLPFIAAGFLAAKSEKLFKKILPASLEMVFGSGFILITTILPILFIFGPALSFLELGMTKLVGLFENLPFGFGPALLALIWQPLVITGMHVAINIAISIPLMTPEGSTALFPANTLAMFGQIGIAIGIAIFTKNRTLRRVSLGAIPSGIFGITEPIIFGITLPRIKPFFLGCFAAFLVTILSTNLGIRQDIQIGGPGIFYPFTNFTNFRDQILYFLMVCLVIAVSIVFVFLFYKERKSELSYASKIMRKIERIIKAKYFDLFNELKVESKNIKETYLKNKKMYKEYEIYLQKLINLKSKLNSIEDKENDVKAEMYLSIKKNYNNPKYSIQKINESIVKYNNYNLDSIKKELSLKIDNLILENTELIKQYEEVKTENQNSTIDYLNTIEKSTKNQKFSMFSNDFWNSYNCIEIGYGLDESKPSISKETITKEFYEGIDFKYKVKKLFGGKIENEG